MNKDFVKFALIGLTAGFCLSAQAAPQKNDKEIAMSKCSKDNSQQKNGGNGSCNGSCSNGNGNSSCSSNGKSKNSSCSSSCNSSDDQSDAAPQMKGKRKSAAQKVVQGN